LMSSIREGRRLILRDGEGGLVGEDGELADGAAAGDPVTAPAEPAAAGPTERGGLASFVEASRGTLEDWQKKLDDRVRTTLTAWKPFLQMQGEVRRLSQRIEELEARLVGAARKGRDSGKDPDGKAE